MVVVTAVVMAAKSVGQKVAVMAATMVPLLDLLKVAGKVVVKVLMMADRMVV